MNESESPPSSDVRGGCQEGWFPRRRAPVVVAATPAPFNITPGMLFTAHTRMHMSHLISIIHMEHILINTRRYFAYVVV